MKKAFLSLLLTLLVFLVACGGSSNSTPFSSQPTPLPSQVKLNITSASSLVGQTAQFSANIPVNWSVTEKNGGSITSNGLYTAPANVGVFHVVATAVSDSSKTATATINVSAKFGHVQEIPNGEAPYSVTPILSTVAPDGTITSANVIDTSTNKPVDTKMEDVTLSPDGTKAVFTQMTVDANLDTEYQAIWIANVDGSSIKQLTYPSTPTTRANDLYPSFTPDGKRVVYTRMIGATPPAFPSDAIMSVATDGTDQQTIFAGSSLNEYGWSILNPAIWHAAVSPDGKMVATEMAYNIDTSYYDGIATMTVTGQNLMQLTGDQATICPYVGGGWDEMPTYSSDGTLIVFSRLCDMDSESGPYYQTESIMSINAADGTNPKQLHAPQGLISCQPRAVANQIAFSSNVDNPATDWFDIYMMNTDGSNLVRVTNNQLYDGFSIWWMNGNYPETTDAKVLARAKKISPLQQRLDHVKQMREHRARR